MWGKGTILYIKPLTERYLILSQMYLEHIKDRKGNKRDRER